MFGENVQGGKSDSENDSNWNNVDRFMLGASWGSYEILLWTIIDCGLRN